MRTDQQTVRKSYKEKLHPTPTQERALEEVLWRCRELYNTALGQRITAWQRCRVSVSRYEQEAELKAIRAAFPQYAAIHSHIPQDVLARLDRTYQAFFRRVQRGERADFPRFKRAKAVLAVAGGATYTAAAQAAGRRSGDAVGRLVARFNQEGLEAVVPRHGGGQSKRYTSTERERILAEARRVPTPTPMARPPGRW
jgi:hypothetical protein